MALKNHKELIKGVGSGAVRETSYGKECSHKGDRQELKLVEQAGSNNGMSYQLILRV
jgi:hypothetical protein